ncbi:E3 ubiquitin-protein ligase Topors-like [Drosophila sulfurigaster albostrigata]|uniref:E3 ubiquitin-protein ligase Topors-like n=1 Tax=Drosophila sulfurigaster albostrigata TaxID=89887 RepID=UPI002D21A0B6|nr:E3 ubiquitin-protein ligase Topors-like [Drosophila sulfurigaster albostrigata]
MATDGSELPGISIRHTTTSNVGSQTVAINLSMRRPANEVIEIDDGDAAANAEVAAINDGSSTTGRRQTGASLPISAHIELQSSDCSNSSDDDDECVFVLERKPSHLRMPEELVSLESNSDSDVDFVDEQKASPVAKANDGEGDGDTVSIDQEMETSVNELFMGPSTSTGVCSTAGKNWMLVLDEARLHDPMCLRMRFKRNLTRAQQRAAPKAPSSNSEGTRWSTSSNIIRVCKQIMAESLLLGEAPPSIMEDMASSVIVEPPAVSDTVGGGTLPALAAHFADLTESGSESGDEPSVDARDQQEQETGGSSDAVGGHNATAGRSSPPPNCAICLSRCRRKCFTDSCMHQFCFKCLCEWSKIKPECPLCKQPFKTIIHMFNEQSLGVEDAMRYLQNALPSASDDAQLGIYSDASNELQHYRADAEPELAIDVVGEATSNAAAESADVILGNDIEPENENEEIDNEREEIELANQPDEPDEEEHDEQDQEEENDEDYQDEDEAAAAATAESDQTDSDPDPDAYNPRTTATTTTTTASEWSSRTPRPSTSVIVTNPSATHSFSVTMATDGSELPGISIRHTITSNVGSQTVAINISMRRPANEVIEIDDGDAAANAEVAAINDGSSTTGRRQTGTSLPIRTHIELQSSDCSNSSDDDDECVFVLEQKPPHLRTPELISLDSNSDSDVDFVDEQKASPVAKANDGEGDGDTVSIDQEMETSVNELFMGPSTSTGVCSTAGKNWMLVLDEARLHDPMCLRMRFKRNLTRAQQRAAPKAPSSNSEGTRWSTSSNIIRVCKQIMAESLLLGEAPPSIMEDMASSVIVEPPAVSDTVGGGTLPALAAHFADLTESGSESGDEPSVDARDQQEQETGGSSDAVGGHNATAGRSSPPPNCALCLFRRRLEYFTDSWMQAGTSLPISTHIELQSSDCIQSSDCSNSSDDDDECVFVLEQKPPHLRTPELISLDSNSDSDVDFVDEQKASPVAKANDGEGDGDSVSIDQEMETAVNELFMGPSTSTGVCSTAGKNWMLVLEEARRHDPMCLRMRSKRNLTRAQQRAAPKAPSSSSEGTCWSTSSDSSSSSEDSTAAAKRRKRRAARKPKAKAQKRPASSKRSAQQLKSKRRRKQVSEVEEEAEAAAEEEEEKATKASSSNSSSSSSSSSDDSSEDGAAGDSTEPTEIESKLVADKETFVGEEILEQQAPEEEVTASSAQHAVVKRRRSNSSSNQSSSHSHSNSAISTLASHNTTMSSSSVLSLFNNNIHRDVGEATSSERPLSMVATADSLLELSTSFSILNVAK